MKTSRDMNGDQIQVGDYVIINKSMVASNVGGVGLVSTITRDSIHGDIVHLDFTAPGSSCHPQSVAANRKSYAIRVQSITVLREQDDGVYEGDHWV